MRTHFNFQLAISSSVHFTGAYRGRVTVQPRQYMQHTACSNLLPVPFPPPPPRTHTRMPLKQVQRRLPVGMLLLRILSHYCCLERRPPNSPSRCTHAPVVCAVL